MFDNLRNLEKEYVRAIDKARKFTGICPFNTGVQDFLVRGIRKKQHFGSSRNSQKALYPA